jgi:hypothetical protein
VKNGGAGDACTASGIGLKLMKLILKEGSMRTLKASRESTKQRKSFVVKFVSRSEEKTFGDWEMVETKTKYQKGHKQLNKPSDYSGGNFGGY